MKLYVFFRFKSISMRLLETVAVYISLFMMAEATGQKSKGTKGGESIAKRFLNLTFRFSFYYCMSVVLGSILSSIRVPNALELVKGARSFAVKTGAGIPLYALSGLTSGSVKLGRFVKNGLEIGEDQSLEEALMMKEHSAIPILEQGMTEQSLNYNAGLGMFNQMYSEWVELSKKRLQARLNGLANEKALKHAEDLLQLKESQIKEFLSNWSKFLEVPDEADVIEATEVDGGESVEIDKKPENPLLIEWKKLETDWYTQMNLAQELTDSSVVKKQTRDAVPFKAQLISVLRAIAPSVGKTLLAAEALVKNEIEAGAIRDALNKALEGFEVGRLEYLGKSFGEFAKFEYNELYPKAKKLYDYTLPFVDRMAFFLAYTAAEFGPATCVDVMNLIATNPQIATQFVSNLVSNQIIPTTLLMKKSLKEYITRIAPEEMKPLFEKAAGHLVEN